MAERQRPGEVRDAILGFYRDLDTADASVADVVAGVGERLGRPVAESSVRSYLGLNTPGTFERTGRGRYALVGRR
ncbi:MAG: hypothetical protein FWH11_08625 [Micrococcales bacterium]|nr:hypothetical protein [Micrococcales bacterium]